MTATPRHITHNNFVYFSCPSPDRQVLILSPTLTVHSFSSEPDPEGRPPRRGAAAGSTLLLLEPEVRVQ